MRTFLALIIVGVMLTGCGGKIDEAAQAMKSLETMAESAEEAQANQDVVSKRREERKAKGDTLTMPADELKAYLPGEIAGYTAADAETSSTQIEGFSFAQATRMYKRADGATVKVELTDWNSSDAGYAGMSLLFAMKWSVDNAQETSGTFQTGDPMINGHERYDKTTKNSTVVYGLGGRFVLNIEAEKQDITFARSVAEKVNLKKLASK